MCKLHILHNGLEWERLHRSQHDDGQHQHPNAQKHDGQKPAGGNDCPADQTRPADGTQRRPEVEVLLEVERG